MDPCLYIRLFVVTINGREMKFTYLLASLIITISNGVIACPGCAGSTNNQADSYTVYVLMGFIIAIYVPFFLLFKTVFKYRNINKVK